MAAAKIKKGDSVVVRSGKDKGRSGTVLQVMPKDEKVLVAGVNIAARIEPKADPDGITVSDVIANACWNKVPAHFQSMGRLPMKNIANPPDLFKAYPIEQQSAAKVAKPGAVPAASAGGSAPGGVFKI